MKDIRRDPKKQGVGKTVLLIDDHAEMRKMLADVFLSDGFKTCGEADNGKEGIEVANQIKPDLIILDLSMPIMNGLQAAPELRKLFPDTPIILFTLYANAFLNQEAKHAGIDLVIAKDEDLSILVSKAHQLMGNED